MQKSSSGKIIILTHLNPEWLLHDVVAGLDVALPGALAPGPLPLELVLGLPLLPVLLLRELLHPGRRLVHEVDRQLVPRLLGEQRLVVVQLLLLVVLSPQVVLLFLLGVRLLLGLVDSLQILRRGRMEELLAHVIVETFTHLERSLFLKIKYITSR